MKQMLQIRQADARGVSDNAVREPFSACAAPTAMHRSIPALLLALAATGTAWAQAPEADPLSSSECLAARDELEKALGEPAGAGRQARRDRLARARQQAATACLGRDSGSRERSGAPQPARTVPPVLPPAVAAPPPLPAIAPAPPPLAAPRAAITTCDPAGCWDSEGRRLNNMGPLLVGPRGLCMLQGGVLNCP